MKLVRIAGAGLAGSAAAIAARNAGSAVQFWDPARLPKHKVCGEFLTPEICPVLEKLGLWDRFLAVQPARMTRMRLVFGTRAAEGRFPEPAFGISRYVLDALLRGEAKSRGGQWIPDRAPGQVDIVAHGRRSVAPGEDRMFGFKTHFQGPCSDAVELYFFNDFYVGVNPVEGGITNVCGLGRESILRCFKFDYDHVLGLNCPLADRLRPLSRQMEWLSTGPLQYQSRLHERAPDTFLAGDALQFVDPFTGTGMATAIWTGALAGKWCAEARPLAEYYALVSEGIAQQYRWCCWLRTAIQKRWPLRLAPFIPPSLIYELTRPKIEGR